MYTIGIDIGKNYHEVSIVDAFGNPIGHSLCFSNTHKGADKLMAHITKHIQDKPFLFGMEAAGHYWYSIYSFPKSQGFTVHVINPIQSNSIRSLFIRQTKNDSKDFQGFFPNR